MKSRSDDFHFEGIGSVDSETEQYDMEFIQVGPELLAADKESRLIETPMVLNGNNLRVEPAEGTTVLAELINPYFFPNTRTFLLAPACTESGGQRLSSGFAKPSRKYRLFCTQDFHPVHRPRSVPLPRACDGGEWIT